MKTDKIVKKPVKVFTKVIHINKCSTCGDELGAGGVCHSCRMEEKEYYD